MSKRAATSPSNAGEVPEIPDTLVADAIGAGHDGGHADFMALQWYRERSDLDLDHFLLSLYYIRLGTMVERHFTELCEARYGISGSDMRVLFALRRGGRPYAKRPTDLFRVLLVTSGAVTKKVDRLLAIGYAVRLPDPAHGGGFLIHLTKKGLQITDEAVELLSRDSVLKPALASLSKAEVRQALHFAARALTAIEMAAKREVHAEKEKQGRSSRAAKRAAPAKKGRG